MFFKIILHKDGPYKVLDHTMFFKSYLPNFKDQEIKHKHPDF